MGPKLNWFGGFPSPATQPLKNLDSQTAGRLWDDLAGADAGKAFQAICTLAQSPNIRRIKSLICGFRKGLGDGAFIALVGKE